LQNGWNHRAWRKKKKDEALALKAFQSARERGEKSARILHRLEPQAHGHERGDIIEDNAINFLHYDGKKD
jgi:hypothetical protein